MTETNTGVVCESKPKKNEVCVPLARCCLAADSLQSDTRLLPQHPSPMGQHCSAISPRSPVGTLVPLCFFKSVKTAVTNIEFRKTAYLIVILASLWGSMNSYISKCLSCNDHTAEATQPLFWLSRSPGVKAIHPYVGWTLLKAFRMTRSIWCPYLPLFLKSEKVSSFFVLFHWYLLLADTDWFYLNIFPALFLIYGKFQIYQRVICFDLHLEHILSSMPGAAQQSLDRGLCHIPSPSAPRSASLLRPVQPLKDAVPHHTALKATAEKQFQFWLSNDPIALTLQFIVSLSETQHFHVIS